MAITLLTPCEFYTCSVKTFRPDEYHITRIYSKSVLILMLGGVLHFREAGIDYELRKDEYYIQREGLLQQGVKLSKDPPVYFFIEFKGNYSDDNEGLPLRGRFDSQKIRPLIEAYDNAYKNLSADPFLLNAYMYRIFSDLLMGFNNKREGKNKVAVMVKNYIDAMYSSQLSLKDVAAKFGYTKDYLTRIFSSEYGITPYQYLKNVRLEYALWLLQNTALSIKQIAHQVGYEYTSSFYRAFLDVYGESPDSIRQNKLLSLTLTQN